jgi:plasmid stabilization system protein ParE
MSYRISPQAEGQLDNISDRFWLLAKQPRMGRRRPDLTAALQSFAAGDYVILYSIFD